MGRAIGSCAVVGKAVGPRKLDERVHNKEARKNRYIRVGSYLGSGRRWEIMGWEYYEQLLNQTKESNFFTWAVGALSLCPPARLLVRVKPSTMSLFQGCRLLTQSGVHHHMVILAITMARKEAPGIACWHHICKTKEVGRAM